MPNMPDTPFDDHQHALRLMLQRLRTSMPAAIRLRVSVQQHAQDVTAVSDALAAALETLNACLAVPRGGDVPPDRGGAR